MTIGEGKVVWLFFENITEYLFSLFNPLGVIISRKIN